MPVRPVFAKAYGYDRHLETYCQAGDQFRSEKGAKKKAVAEAKEQTIKLAIRLNEGINEALRTLIRYRGDLSTMALEALDAVDLTRGRPSQRGRADGSGHHDHNAAGAAQQVEKNCG